MYHKLYSTIPSIYTTVTFDEALNAHSIKCYLYHVYMKYNRHEICNKSFIFNNEKQVRQN